MVSPEFAIRRGLFSDRPLRDWDRGVYSLIGRPGDGLWASTDPRNEPSGGVRWQGSLAQRIKRAPNAPPHPRRTQAPARGIKFPISFPMSCGVPRRQTPGRTKWSLKAEARLASRGRRTPVGGKGSAALYLWRPARRNWLGPVGSRGWAEKTE